MKKRKLWIFIAVLLLVAGLVLVYVLDRPPDAAPGTELSERWKKEIKTAWNAAYSKNADFRWFGEGNIEENIEYYHSARHYGTYNGYVVVFIPPFIGGATHGQEEVAGYVFNYGWAFHLLVYRNGRFTDLKEAYKAGKLTKEDIGEIYEYHKKTFPIHYS